MQRLAGHVSNGDFPFAQLDTLICESTVVGGDFPAREETEREMEKRLFKGESPLPKHDPATQVHIVVDAPELEAQLVYAELRLDSNARYRRARGYLN